MKYLVFLFLLIASQVEAATIFVDGNNIYGAATSCTTYRVGVRDCVGGNAVAYKTIALAIAALGSGDTLNIRAGTYNEKINGFVPSQSGTASATGWGTSAWSESGATIIQAYQAETVTLAGNNTSGTALGFSTPSGVGTELKFFIFRNLRVDGSNNGGTALGGGNNGGTVHHIKMDGIEVFGVTTSQPSASAFTVGSALNDTHDIWLNNVSAHDSAAGQEEFHIHCWYVEASNTIVENSSCYNWHIGYAIHQYTGTFQPDGNIYRNLTIHNVNSNSTSLAAFFLYNGTNTTIQNSLVYDNDDGLYMQNNDNVQVVNNTFFRNAVRSGHLGVQPGTLTFAFTAGGANPTAINNIIYGNQHDSISGTGTFTNNIFTNPSFVNTASVPPNLHLASNSSSAYNTGTNTGCPSLDKDGIVRPQAFTCDAGAYEFLNLVPPPTVVITSPTSNPTVTVSTSTINLGGTSSLP